MPAAGAQILGDQDEKELSSRSSFRSENKKGEEKRRGGEEEEEKKRRGEE